MTTDEILASIGMKESAKDTRDKMLGLIASYKKAGYSKREVMLWMEGSYRIMQMECLWPYFRYLLKKNWGKL